MAQGIPQPLAAPGQVMVHQQAAVVAAADQEGDAVFAPRLDVGRDLPMGRQAPNRTRVLTAMTLAVRHRPIA